MWSKCVCVRRIASRPTPAPAIASSRRSASSPGSTSTARSPPSGRTRWAFSASGPTVSERTSTSVRATALGGALLRALAPAVEREVGEVAERDVEEQHEAAERDRLRDRALEDEADQHHEDDRRDGRAGGRALPGRGLVQPRQPLVPGLVLGRRGRRAALVGLAARLDDARSVAAVLRP